MRLFLVRHGQTEWNRIGRAQGHQDTPLDETGLRQAARLPEAFKPGEIHRILCSDLQRAIRTAEPLAQAFNLEIETTPTLRERCFGEWEGLSYKEFQTYVQEKSEGDPFHFRAPGGDSLADVWQRTATLAEQLKNQQENTLVLSHGGTLAILLAQLITDPKNLTFGPTYRAFRFENAAVTELRRREDGAHQLFRYNDSRHLEPAHAAR
jgi:broad specificity phosphatase PhoE